MEEKGLKYYSELYKYFGPQFFGDPLNEQDTMVVKRLNWGKMQAEKYILDIHLHIIQTINDIQSHKGKKENYTAMVINMAILYRCVAKAPEINKEVAEYISEISHIMCILDTSIVNAKPLKPSDADKVGSKEFSEKLKKLDEARDDFLNKYKQAYVSFLKDTIGAETWIYCFARLLYEFNGYQAPPRTSIYTATVDIDNLINYFDEFDTELKEKHKMEKAKK